jgi:hypothetical protein
MRIQARAGMVREGWSSGIGSVENIDAQGFRRVHGAENGEMGRCDQEIRRGRIDAFFSPSAERRARMIIP